MKEEKTKTIKKDYKKAPLAKVHLRVLTAIALGLASGFSLGITGVAPIIFKLVTRGLD